MNFSKFYYPAVDKNCFSGMVFLEFSVNLIKLAKFAFFFFPFLKFCVKVAFDQTLEEYKY